MADWLGIDIGGANLKIANADQFAVTRPFKIWRHPTQLAAQLNRLLSIAPRAGGLAVTMTAELADCFQTKSEGVRTILDAVSQVADWRRVRVYFIDGRFASVDEARDNPLMAAAANWHALGNFAGRFVSGEHALLIDVGSTTTDIIPLVHGQVATSALDDTTRLIQRELHYTGVIRSPICAVTSTVPFRGRACPVAQEMFATMRDAYVVLGCLPPNPDDLNTADGRPATIDDSIRRLARCICADSDSFDRDDAIALSEFVQRQQYTGLKESISRVVNRLKLDVSAMVVSGQGEFLALRLARGLGNKVAIMSLAGLIGQPASQCAPAHALAVLARERIDE